MGMTRDQQLEQLLEIMKERPRHSAIATDKEGREVYCFTRYGDACWFSFKASFRGVRFEWTEDYDDQGRKWFILTPVMYGDVNVSLKSFGLRKK